MELPDRFGVFRYLHDAVTLSTAKWVIMPNESLAGVETSVAGTWRTLQRAVVGFSPRSALTAS